MCLVDRTFPEVIGVQHTPSAHREDVSREFGDFSQGISLNTLWRSHTGDGCSNGSMIETKITGDDWLSTKVSEFIQIRWFDVG
jgi:hypothetical protein